MMYGLVISHKQTLKIQFAPNFVIVCFSFFSRVQSPLLQWTLSGILKLCTEHWWNKEILSSVVLTYIYIEGDTASVLECWIEAKYLICAHIFKVAQELTIYFNHLQRIPTRLQTRDFCGCKFIFLFETIWHI